MNKIKMIFIVLVLLMATGCNAQKQCENGCEVYNNDLKIYIL